MNQLSGSGLKGKSGAIVGAFPSTFHLNSVEVRWPYASKATKYFVPEVVPALTFVVNEVPVFGVISIDFVSEAAGIELIFSDETKSLAPLVSLTFPVTIKSAS